MQIGPYTIETPLALAPMVGVTDRFFRQLCRSLGAGYTVSEMLAADPALRETRTARMRGDFVGETSPIAVQIAGSEPRWMAAAARYNVDRGAEIIDINMGCPAKKVCKKLAGSALLSDPGQVREILQAVVAAVEVPVTLKIRTGPNPRERNGVDIARMAESEGVAALAVHGRTRSDRFRGEAEYETIRAICQAVQIPVFANGDILTPARAAAVLDYTGADGLMIGRAAQGNPWIFREIKTYLETGHVSAAPSAKEVHEVMTSHLRQLHRSYGEPTGVRVARKHIGWYLEGRENAGATRSRLMRAKTAVEQFDILEGYFERESRKGTKAA
ncbi:MAG: tRNA dihydrouridine synthase DusB [Xanthomonadales bacterium]|jgi:tRNA-dihydrouridine synthase B|nr:tRNA dihydrouridine synthase DusB [Xanthomonadales bacterium]